MTHVSGSNASHIQKTLLKAGLAAAAPGIVALTAAFTAPVNILQQYAGMGSMGVAAMGVIFLGAAYFFAKGHWWGGIPALACSGWALWAIASIAIRLLSLYYSHNPVKTMGDVFAPFPFISLQLTLLFITATIGYILIKAFLLSRTLSPQPVNRLVWGSMSLWLVVVMLDCMNKF